MNNALFITFLTLVFVSALMISSGVIPLSNACPSKNSPTATSTTNQVNPTNIDTLLSQSSSSQLSASQAT